jgi:uncharacterized protein (TIGR02594 family)
MSKQVLQPWMQEAIRLIGTKEVPGSADNQLILTWAESLDKDIADTYTDDSIPWCGLFTAHCIQTGGFEPVDEPLWALNWAHFGYELEEPAFGAILSFSRNGGGHVGFYISEDDEYYHVLGGNQMDMVCIKKVAKANCKGIRWPDGAAEFYQPGIIIAELDEMVISSSQMA